MAWVEAGGTLVVTDVSSPLSPVATRSVAVAFLDPQLTRDCAVPALRQVLRVDAPDAILQEVPEGATGCFRLGEEEAWLVVAPIGEGTIVSIGGAGFLVNRALDDADNGLLAVTLLAPTRSERVVVLRPPAPGEGETGLLDLVDRRVKLAVLQLVVAFLVLVLWRSRRLGRPVLEPQPVPLAGSELVVAVGRAPAAGQGTGTGGRGAARRPPPVAGRAIGTPAGHARRRGGGGGRRGPHVQRVRGPHRRGGPGRAGGRAAGERG